VSKRRLRAVSPALVCLTLLLGACGGESAHHGAPNGGSGATGGASTTGGDSGAGGSGGSNDKGGDAGSSGSAPVSACGKVTCPAIPTSCKRIVQEPDACCPTCLDTGCDPCPALDCAEGTHSETVPGDCCPSCVADPPDACTTGQMEYADLRAALLDKYGSSGCANSSDCTLVSEHNACNVACNVALPAVTAVNFTSNLDARATDCATCPPPAELDCEAQLAACVNGHCVAVDATSK